VLGSVARRNFCHPWSWKLAHRRPPPWRLRMPGSRRRSGLEAMEEEPKDEEDSPWPLADSSDEEDEDDEVAYGWPMSEETREAQAAWRVMHEITYGGGESEGSGRLGQPKDVCVNMCLKRGYNRRRAEQLGIPEGTCPGGRRPLCEVCGRPRHHANARRCRVCRRSGCIACTRLRGPRPGRVMMCVGCYNSLHPERYIPDGRCLVCGGICRRCDMQIYGDGNFCHPV
jgi:hypothetical protein